MASSDNAPSGAPACPYATTAKTFGIVTIVIGAFVLAGWACGIAVLKTILPGYISMKANTAVAFILQGLALVTSVSTAAPPSRLRRRHSLSVIFSVGALVIGALTLIEYLADINLGIDELLFSDPLPPGAFWPPGRLAPVTAINFILLSFATLKMVLTPSRSLQLAQFLCVGVFLLSVQSLIGYGIGVNATFGVAFYTRMAIHTALAFALLSSGLLLSRSSEGFMLFLTEASVTGRMVRQLMATAILVPPLLNWAEIRGQNAGYYDADFGLLLRLIGNVAFLLLIVWKNAVALHQADRKRTSFEEDLRANNEHLRAAMAALSRSESQLRLVTNSLPASIMYFDAAGRCTFMNSTYVHWLTGVREVPADWDPTAFSETSEYAAIKPYFSRALGGETVEFEYTSATASRDVHVTFVPDVGDQGGIRGFFALGHDITERKRQEGERATLVADKVAAKEASRLKSQFLATMSHEIRTPISGVMGMIELLKDTPLSDEQKVYVEGAERTSSVLLGLISDILDISKIEAGKLDFHVAPFDLRALVDGIEELFQPLASSKSLRLTMLYENGAPTWFEGDVNRIRQILVNLIGNAIKFTTIGAVSVVVRLLGIGARSFRLRCEVEDSGIGIPAEVLGRLFQPFSQADPSTTKRFGGAGLGLSISRHLVDRMNGTIGVDSKVGEGSRFWFELNLQHCEPTAADIGPGPGAAALPETRSVAGPQSLKVLVAEDNAMNQVVTMRAMERLGIKAQLVQNGREVLAAVQADLFDLILMDCRMPEMDGYEVTRLIRSNRAKDIRRLPIVAMTANALNGDRDVCIAVGMNDYLSKPINRSELRQVIDRWTVMPSLSRCFLHLRDALEYGDAAEVVAAAEALGDACAVHDQGDARKVCSRLIVAVKTHQPFDAATIRAQIAKALATALTV